jgi:hypothetical protein
MQRVTILLVFASLPFFAGPAFGESWSKRLTRKETGDPMYAFTIKAERLETVTTSEQTIAAGEFLEFHVTVKPVATAEQLQEARKQGWRPRYSGQLRVSSGNEFIAACELKPTQRDAEFSYSFQVARKYAEKSVFAFDIAEGHDDGGISYWFYLEDFAEPR